LPAADGDRGETMAAGTGSNELAEQPDEQYRA
jgi:hypothetical protein